MAMLHPDVKAKLKADGRWGAFMKFRMERRAEGVKPSEALNMAIAAVCPEFAEASSSGKPGRRPSGGRRARERGRTEEKERADAVERIVAAKEKLAQMEADAEAKRSANAGGLVGAEVFEGKPKASAADEVLWVAKHLGVEVKPEDAPGELAWNFLMLCRESAEFKVKFMLNIASDVVKRRSDEEGENGGKWDGVKQYDLCEAMKGVQV